MNPSQPNFVHENRAINFSKYNACGNDFIIVDGKSRAGSLLEQTQFFARYASFLCDRHRGIGADGILLVVDEQSLIKAVVINSDGSIAQNCGNGLRCIARWGFAKNPSPFRIELGGRSYQCFDEGDTIKIAMGEGTIQQGPQLKVPGALYLANVANKHLILLSDELPDRIDAVTKIKQEFPDWADYNLGFLSRLTHKSLVYERGVGFTESCGSGAIAAAMALWMCGDHSGHYLIKQPGGCIKVILDPLLSLGVDARFSVVQSGEATEVFQGSLKLPIRGT